VVPLLIGRVFELSEGVPLGIRGGRAVRQYMVSTTDMTYANVLTIRYASCRKTSSPSLPFPLSLARLISLARVGEVARDEPCTMSSLNVAVLSL